MKFTDKQLMALGIVALVLAAGGIWYARRVVGAVGNAVNPVNPDNIFYGAASGVTQAITGDDDDTFGTALHKWLNPETR